MNTDTTYRSTRLLVADDHRIVTQGIERLLLDCFHDVQTVDSGEALIDAVQANPPDLVIADISMDGLSGIEAMRMLRAAGCQIPFIILTMHADHAMAAAAIRAGASGYVLKSAAGDELVRAVREVMAGHTYVTPTLAARTLSLTAPAHPVLTEKQTRILMWVAQGLRSKQIAYELGVSVRTVESHKYAIMQELGVHGTVELVRKAEQLGMISGFAPQPVT